MRTPIPIACTAYLQSTSNAQAFPKQDIVVQAIPGKEAQAAVPGRAQCIATNDNTVLAQTLQRIGRVSAKRLGFHLLSACIQIAR
jgi:hypothetical protein